MMEKMLQIYIQWEFKFWKKKDDWEVKILFNCALKQALKQVIRILEDFYTYEADVNIVITPLRNCLNVGKASAHESSC